MTAIVTLDQQVQALTSALTTAGAGSPSVTALQTAMVSAGLISKSVAVGASSTTTINLAAVVDAGTRLTPMVWPGITNGTAAVNGYGSFNTSPITLSANIGGTATSASFPAGSVFTFSRPVAALVTFTLGGYVDCTGATSIANCGACMIDTLGGTSFTPFSAVSTQGIGLTTFTVAYSATGNYNAGDSVAVAGYTSNLAASDASGIVAAAMGNLAGGYPTFTVVNFN